MGLAIMAAGPVRAEMTALGLSSLTSVSLWCGISGCFALHPRRICSTPTPPSYHLSAPLLPVFPPVRSQGARAFNSRHSRSSSTRLQYNQSRFLAAECLSLVPVTHVGEPRAWLSITEPRYLTLFRQRSEIKRIAFHMMYGS